MIKIPENAQVILNATELQNLLHLLSASSGILVNLAITLNNSKYQILSDNIDSSAKNIINKIDFVN